MPLIKPRAHRVTYVRHAYRLSAPMREVLVQYARFIGESPDYVLNAVIETTLAKDRDYLAWRAGSEAGAAPHPGEPTPVIQAGERPVR